MADSKRNIKGAAQSAAFFDRSKAPVFERRIEGYRSLPKEGFAVTIAFTMIMLFLPMFAVLGTPVLWGLLAPALLVLGALWIAIRRNTEDGTVYEEIKLWPNLLEITHVKPRKPAISWEANPYWVKAHLRQRNNIENYLTLTGGEREIELGSFLQPEERLTLKKDLEKALRDVRLV